MKSKGSQNNYSDIMGHNVYDINGRKVKARKIIAIIKTHHANEINDLTVLDYGCSTGIISTEIARHVKYVVGYDIDNKALEYANKYSKSSKISNIKFVSNINTKIKFDIIICNQIYEHVENIENMLNDINNLLNRDGIVYFGATNKYCLIEPHYRLLFLSWLPKNIANYYLSIFTKHKYYYEDLLGYTKLYNLVSRYFNINDVSIDIVKNPKKYFALDIELLHYISFIPRWVLDIFKYIFPNWIWILNLKNEKSNSD